MATDPVILERKFHALFNQLDSDKNDELNWDDCVRPAEKARKELGWSATDVRFTLMMKLMRACWDACIQANDLDHSGTISYKEFLLFIVKTNVEMTNSKKLPMWALFSGAGITQNEYAIYLRSIGSDADPKSVFARLDADKDGKISIEELYTLLWQYLSSDDPNVPGNYLLTGKF